MVYGILSSFNNVSAVEFFYIFGAALACVGVLGAWMESDAPDGKEEIEERLNSATRFVSDIISYIFARREEASNAENLPPEEVQDSKDSKNEEDDIESDANDVNAVISQEEQGVNKGRYWRDDYWNFENSIENDLFAAEQEQKNEAEQWRESLEEEKESSGENVENDEPDRQQGRANYFGAFFRSRHYPADVFEENERKDDSDAPKRWRRNKNTEQDNKANDENDSNKVDTTAENRSDNVLSDEELDRLFNGKIDDDSEDEETLFEPDYDYLDDESVDLDEKIKYLRKRARDDDESRSTLIQMLIQRAAMAKADEEKVAMDALDEVERLLDESSEDDQVLDGEFGRGTFENDDEMMRMQAMLQRPFYYLRTGKEPPMELANSALARVKKWANETESDEARRLLATAWLVHGNCLLAFGAEASGLKSLLESRRIFQELVDAGVEEARPSIGFISSAIGEAYKSIGDYERAAAYYRKSVDAFDVFSAQEGFLSEKVNASFRLNLALRSMGKIEEADRVLEEAIEAEERLLSYNEETYFAPLTTLLEAQADAFAMRGEHQEALAALDRAISTIENFLSYDSPISRRVLAYAHVENALRRRAVIYMGQKRYSLAARDLAKAAEYLGLAVKKDPAFNAVVQLTISACLIADLCALHGSWDCYARICAELKKFLDKLSDEERKQVLPIFAQLLLQRHNILAAVGKRKEAAGANVEAVKLLEDAYKEDDSKADIQIALAKALAQRGFVKLDKKRAAFVSIKDLRRAKMLLESGLENDQLDDATTKFLIELLQEKAVVEARSGSTNVAQEDMRLAVRTVWGKLRAQKWDYLDYLAALSRVSLKLANDPDKPVFMLRIARLWLRYIERLRRNYVETSLTVDGPGDDSLANKEFLYKIEAFLLDVRKTRCACLENVKWEPQFEKYYDLRAFKELIAKSKYNSVSKEQEESVDQRLARLRRVIAGKAYDEERERFICENLANDSKALALFADRDFTLRVLRRRFSEWEPGLGLFVVPLTEKIAESARNYDDLVFELANTMESARPLNEVLQKLDSDSPKDVKLLSDLVKSSALLSLEADVLYRVFQDVEERAIKARNEAGDDLDKELEDKRKETLNLLQTMVEKTYLLGIKLAKFSNPSDPTARLQIGAHVAEYFSWLLRMGRKEDALEVVKTESEAMDKLAQSRLPLDMLAVSLFYDALAASSIEVANDVELSKKLLLKVENALNKEREVVGENPTIHERIGFVYDRIGSLYPDSDPDKARNYVQALDNYSRAMQEGRLIVPVFNRFVQLMMFMLENGDDKARRKCSKMYRQAERAFEASPKRRRRELAAAFWEMTFALKEWQERERHCYVAAKRSIERLEDLMTYSVKDETVDELKQIDTHMVAANFWIRQNNRKRAKNSLDNALILLRKHLAAFERLDEPDVQSSEETVLKDARRQLALALMLKAQLMTLDEHPADPQGSGPLLQATLEEAEKLIATFPVTNLDNFPRISRGEKVKVFCKYWASMFGGKLRSIYGEALAKFGRKEAAETLSNENEPEFESERPLSPSVYEQQLLTTFFMLRLFRILYDIDAQPDLNVNDVFKKLIADIRLACGKDSFVEVICKYYLADMMLRQKRYTECIRLVRYVLRQFPKGAMEPGFFIDNATPFLIDAYRMLSLAALERGGLGDRRRGRVWVELALKGCRSAFLVGRFFMRSVYIETLYVFARYELLDGRCKRALEIAKDVKRQLRIARRRQITSSGLSFDNDVEVLIAQAAAAVAKNERGVKQTSAVVENSPESVDKNAEREHN